MKTKSANQLLSTVLSKNYSFVGFCLNCSYINCSMLNSRNVDSENCIYDLKLFWISVTRN